MKIGLITKLADIGIRIYDRLTEKNPPTKKEVVTTAIIAVLTYLLTVYGGVGLADLENIADFSIGTYQKLED